MKFPRRHRFKRAPTSAPIQLTERDKTILRHVHRHRFLRSSHITALIGCDSPHLLRRLQWMYHHGYLERPRAQLDYFHKGGSRHMVYGLGSKGAAVLRAEMGGDSIHVRWNEKNRSVGRMFLDHALLVSDVMVTLELTCRQRGIRLVSEQELAPMTGSKRKAFRWTVNLNNKVKLGVIPDRVFALENPGHNGTSERAFFFLAVDRGTMPVTRRSLSQTSIHRKLLAYEATWSQAIHQRQFGFHRFRVLTVTSSAARLKSIIESCSQLERGHGLFLFADRSILTKDIFSDWQTARAGEMGSLTPLENQMSH